jgi:hypothetical protein
VALSSPRRTLDGILRAVAVSDEEWGSTSAMNLPALSTTAREMAAALDGVTGADTSALIDWAPDPAIDALVRTWPARLRTPRAAALGLTPEQSLEDIVRAYVADNSGAVVSPSAAP